jgi:hypothetical protein
MCEEMNCSLLGQMPLDPQLLIVTEQGKSIVKEKPESEPAKALIGIVN